MILKSCDVLENMAILTFIELIINSTLAAVDPRTAVKNSIKVNSELLQAGDHSVHLEPLSRLRLVAIGKAAQEMASGAMDVLADRIVDGLVISKFLNHEITFPANFQVLKGGHPVPNQESLSSGQALNRFCQGSYRQDVFLTLISGGGSALVQMPVEGIPLQDLQMITRSLLHCGATIEKLNTVRKHLDLVKGGGLVKMAAPARGISLIISDVKGDRLDFIASGMTVEDTTTVRDALQIISTHGLLADTPESILRILSNDIKQMVLNTTYPGGEELNWWGNTILLNNASAVHAVIQTARQAGWKAENLGWVLEGEARDAGEKLAEMLTRISEDSMIQKPICLVGGGETVVQVKGLGIGGRNLEVALGAVEGLGLLDNVALITLATDGEDGETGFAGAVVTSKTKRIAEKLDLKTQNYLEENNSCRFFEMAGGLIQTGTTGTNVNDLVILLAW